MKYLVLLLIIFFINIAEGFSQLKFEIADLIVSNIKYNPRKDMVNEDEGEGPFVSINCSLTNETKKPVCILPSGSKITIYFNYDGKNYSVNTVAFIFQERDSVILNPNDIIKFNVGSRLLLGTDLWDEKRTDYTMILLQLLPTLKIQYKDLNLNSISANIARVTIK